MKYQKSIYIHSYETNRFGNSSLGSIFNFLIEIAWEHAQKLNWGFDKLKDNNLFWVLSRIYIEVEKYPKWQDELTLQTWPMGTDGVYAYREFAILNSKGETIVKASSAWLILEMESKQIFRLREYINKFPNFSDEMSCRRPMRIKISKKANGLKFQPVQYTDLDVNQHFNSVKYVERALNHFGIDFLDQHEVASIEINYAKEGLPEDSLAVSRINISEAEDLVSLVRESDMQDLCAMKICWKRK